MRPVGEERESVGSRLLHSLIECTVKPGEGIMSIGLTDWALPANGVDFFGWFKKEQGTSHLL